MAAILDIKGLRKRMWKAGITTDKELADRIGMSRIVVSRWMNGHTQPGVESLQRLAEEFELANIESLLVRKGK